MSGDNDRSSAGRGREHERDWVSIIVLVCIVAGTTCALGFFIIPLIAERYLANQPLLVIIFIAVAGAGLGLKYLPPLLPDRSVRRTAPGKRPPRGLMPNLFCPYCEHELDMTAPPERCPSCGHAVQSLDLPHNGDLK